MGNETQPPSRWRLVRSIVGAVLAVAVLGSFLAWMGGAFHEKVAPGQVAVPRPTAAGRTLVPVEKRKSEDTVSAVGSVQPKKRVEIASQILATVVDIRVRPGDRVMPGQSLVVLDDRELLAQQREAAASLTSAEADQFTRRAEYDRIKKSKAASAASEEEFNKIEGAFRVSEAQVNRAKEVIARLAVQLTHTKIAAGSGGVVADRFVDPGDLATPGKPLLIIYDPNDLELHAGVPESLAPDVPVGAKLLVRIDAAGVVARGMVREVVPQAQQASRSVLVKITLPPATSLKPLLPGMFGRVEIPVGMIDRLWIPREAVFQIGQLDLVEAAAADGTLARRFIRTGQEANGMVEVLSGLTASDRVALPAK